MDTDTGWVNLKGTGSAIHPSDKQNYDFYAKTTGTKTFGILFEENRQIVYEYVKYPSQSRALRPLASSLTAAKIITFMEVLLT